MNDIAGKGIGLAVIGKLFFYASGHLLMTALPVAILAAALMTFGNMGEHNELAAIKSSGISLWKIGRPMIMLSVWVTLLSLWFSFDIVPRANLKFFSLLYDVGRKKAEISLKPGHFYSDIDGYVIRISDKNTESRTLYDVMIYNHSENKGAIDVIAADSARTRSSDTLSNFMKMVLYSGVRHEEYGVGGNRDKKYQYGRTYFDSLIYKFQLKGFELDRTDEGLFARHQITLPKSKLQEALDSLDLKRQNSYKKFFTYLQPYTRIDTAFTDWAPDTTLNKLNAIRSAEMAKRSEEMTKTIDSAFMRGTPRKPTGQDAKRRTSYADKNPIEIDDFPLQVPDSLGNILDSFPNTNRVELITKALSNLRAVKNYAEFMFKKQSEEARRKRRYSYEFHLRHASPFNCIVFMIIGISLGAIIRKGGLGMPALISVALLVAAYVLNAQGKKFSKEGVLDPIVGAWLPIIIFAPIAFFLLYKAVTDSSLMDTARWNLFPEKAKKIIFRKK